MILDVLGWLAVADAVCAVLLAATVYVIGNRSGQPVSFGRAAGLAILLGSPAGLLFLSVYLFSQVGIVSPD